MIGINQFKAILQKLRKPSVILSIVSQIVAILALLNINVDNALVMAIATAACSILTTAGILSNPASDKKGFGDDIYYCEKCGKDSVHTKVDGKLVCSECGNALKEKIKAKQRAEKSDTEKTST